jgi:hypothetical protein
LFPLWKKDEAFDLNYQEKTSKEVEQEPSFASVPKEPAKALKKKENIKIGKQKVTPDKTRGLHKINIRRSIAVCLLSLHTNL